MNKCLIDAYSIIIWRDIFTHLSLRVLVRTFSATIMTELHSWLLHAQQRSILGQLRQMREQKSGQECWLTLSILVNTYGTSQRGWQRRESPIKCWWMSGIKVDDLSLPNWLDWLILWRDIYWNIFGDFFGLCKYCIHFWTVAALWNHNSKRGPLIVQDAHYTHLYLQWMWYGCMFDSISCKKKKLCLQLKAYIKTAVNFLNQFSCHYLQWTISLPALQKKPQAALVFPRLSLC